MKNKLMQQITHWIEQEKQTKMWAVSMGGQGICLVSAAILMLPALLLQDFYLMMASGLFVWMACNFYCIGKISQRFMLLAFNTVVFIFLMCRPLIAVFRGGNLWEMFDASGTRFALISVGVSLLWLQLGAMFYEIRCANCTRAPKPLTLAPKKQDVGAFRLAALLLYSLCMLATLALEYEKLVFMRDRSYYEFYTSFVSKLPSFLYTISEMTPFALCIYLATMPKKAPSFVVLSVFVLSAVPQLIIGIRNPLVLNVLFAFLYYCVRDAMGDPQKWLGKVEKTLIIVGIPLALVALSAFNYIRDGVAVATNGALDAIIDLLYKQGVSFEVLCKAFLVLPVLPGGRKFYTVGPILDAILQGQIGQMLFHAPLFPPGNSAVRAICGNTFAHSMSFVAHPEYLDGHGWGSSYILETYADLGWLGVMLYSFLLGVFLMWMLKGMRQGWLKRTILLAVMSSLLFAPRAEALGSLVFLVRVHFWVILLGCIIGGAILTWLKKLVFRSGPKK